MGKGREERNPEKEEKDRYAFVLDPQTTRDFEKMREDFSFLHKKTVKILRKIGVEAKAITKYMEDSRNFTEGEWEFLQEFKEESLFFKRKILEALGVDVKEKEERKRKKKEKAFENKMEIKKKRARLMKRKVLKKQQDKKSLRHRKHTLGLKKRWLQM